MIRVQFDPPAPRLCRNGTTPGPLDVDTTDPEAVADRVLAHVTPHLPATAGKISVNIVHPTESGAVYVGNGECRFTFTLTDTEGSTP